MLLLAFGRYCLGFCSCHGHFVHDHCLWRPQVKSWSTTMPLQPCRSLRDLLWRSISHRPQAQRHRRTLLALKSWVMPLKPRLATLRSTLRSLWHILKPLRSVLVPLRSTLMTLSILDSSTRVSTEAESRATTTPPDSSVSRRKWCRQIGRWHAMLRLLPDNRLLFLGFLVT